MAKGQMGGTEWIVSVNILTSDTGGVSMTRSLLNSNWWFAAFMRRTSRKRLLILMTLSVLSWAMAYHEPASACHSAMRPLRPRWPLTTILVIIIIIIIASIRVVVISCWNQRHIEQALFSIWLKIAQFQNGHVQKFVQIKIYIRLLESHVSNRTVHNTRTQVRYKSQYSNKTTH